MKPMLIVLMITVPLVLTGCGQYGSLYLPDSKQAQIAKTESLRAKAAE